MGGRGSSSGMSGGSLDSMGRKQLQSMTDEQREAVEYYGMNGQAMNEYLRGENISMYGTFANEIRREANTLNTALSQASLPRDVEAYRGADMAEINSLLRSTPGARQNPGLLVGKTYTNPGFLSTSTDRDYATEYTGQNIGSSTGVLFHVSFEKGAKAVYTDPVYGKGGGWENQILAAPNTRYKIRRAYNGRDGLLHIHMSGGRK